MLTERHALYRLLPAYIRFRDQKAGKELEPLLTIVGDQAAALQRDLERMYDGWFIETCDEWIVPYIGDLLGLEPAHLAPGEAGSERAGRLRQVLSARSATANAIAQRRRKGTLWVLEEIARDLAHWPARAVEFYRHLVVASHLDHLQPARPAIADLRSARRLADLNGPFDEFCHLSDVRRISHGGSRGLYGLPNVGLFVWRLRPYNVSKTPAYCREDAGMHCFTFSALGHDTQLFRAPRPESVRTDIARAEHLPVPLTRWMLERDAPPDAGRAQADPALYGWDAGLLIEVADWPTRSTQTAITAALVIPADLSDWSYKVPKGHVAVDPVLGRIAFPTSQPPRREVKVTYHYGFAMDFGGGEYRRDAVPLPPLIERLQVRPNVKPQPGSPIFPSIAAAYADWRKRRSAPKDPAPAAVLIELSESGVYTGRFNLALQAKETVAVAAAPGTRPVLWLADDAPGASDAITIRGRRGSRVILDGLLIAGRAVEVAADQPDSDEAGAPYGDGESGELCELWIRHSTLVPGNSLQPNCDPRRPSEPSLVVDDTAVCVRIDASILGPIRVLHEGDTREPTPISIADSIVDATSEERVAIGGPSGEIGYAEVKVWRSTVVGRVAVHALRVAEDSIFVSRVDVARRQVGCLRFCYVLPESRTPKRYECQPDTALQDVDARVAAQGPLSKAARAALAARGKATARIRVTPRFESVRYGSAAYLCLAAIVAPEIKRGAHDESEMGVYHDLFEPQRLSMLNDRLAEFVPASCDAAVVFIS
jgi:hypothetical protein